jgi:hypothetical protein
MANDETAIETQKLARASRAPTTAPGTHELISPFPCRDPPLIRTDRGSESPPPLRG